MREAGAELFRHHRGCVVGDVLGSSLRVRAPCARPGTNTRSRAPSGRRAQAVVELGASAVTGPVEHMNVAHRTGVQS